MPSIKCQPQKPIDASTSAGAVRHLHVARVISRTCFTACKNLPQDRFPRQRRVGGSGHGFVCRSELHELFGSDQIRDDLSRGGVI
jgi:hypothetical protein